MQHESFDMVPRMTSILPVALFQFLRRPACQRYPFTKITGAVWLVLLPLILVLCVGLRHRRRIERGWIPFASRWMADEIEVIKASLQIVWRVTTP
jgi:hypothetical protein